MRGLVTGIVGATIGFIAGAAIMRYKDDKRFDATIDDIVEEEVNAWMEDYIAKHKQEEIEEEPEDDDDEEEDVEEDPYEEKMPDGYFDYGNRYKKRDPMDKPENPADILTQHPQDPEDETDILEESPRKKEDDDMKAPKLISADKYDEDPEYRKELLYFYQDDNVLTTEDEEEIDNQLEIVGDCMDKFDFRNNEESYIHVRNQETMTDYEIQKIFSSFRG